MNRVPIRHKLVVVGIALGVGALHFFTGPDYRGPWRGFVTGYLIDILLPFAMYLVMGVTNHEFLRKQTVRWTAVFGVGAVTETLQYFGVPIFGRTFDPLDYLMFAAGIAGAALFEWVVLSRFQENVPP